MTNAEQIFTMEKECFSGDYWSLNALSAQLESEYSLYAVHEDGYALGAICADEVELYRIAVLPSSRRKGRGKQLLNEFLSLCREKSLTAVFLEVRSRNFAAIALYESAGFERIALRKDYYPDDDAVIYRLELSQGNKPL